MQGSTPTVLTIAGSDSSGGAGIQADLKTFAAHGCYGASAITALTAQNTTGVQGVHPCPPEFVEKQITSILDDLDVGAIKTGMLYDAQTVKTVASALTTHFSASTRPPVICDPVCVSTSGHILLHEDAVDVLISDLFPLSTVVTPNKSEAELILSRIGETRSLNSLEGILTAAQSLLSFGCEAVLLKGGHIFTDMAAVLKIQREDSDVKIIKQNLPGDNMEILFVVSPNYKTLSLVVDVLCQKSGEKTLFIRPRIDSSSTHGTGCTLSSAIASKMATGSSLEKAVESATMYTHLGIQAAIPIGKGHGPLNHFPGTTQRLVPLRSPTNPYPFARILIEDSAQIWKEYVEHDFVCQVGKGTLARERFVHFVKQDYLYLKYYARAYSLLAAKSTSFGLIESAMKTVLNVLHEVGNHKAYCAKFGITGDELENTPESSATTAYGAYIVDTGLQGDATRLMMALMACLLGYGEVGLWLKKQSMLPNTWVVLNGNPYLHWIEEYGGTMYQDAVRIGLETIEAVVVADPPSDARFKEWKDVWTKCTRLEKGFWDMAMELRG